MSRMTATIATSLAAWPLLVFPLSGAAEAEPTRDEQPPPGGFFYEQYQGLEAELQRHRALAAAGGWPQVPDGPTMEPGVDDPRLEALARRLAASGDLEDGEVASPDFDATLEEAVRRFQSRHGLNVDGLVGRATLRALNTTIEQRIDQIRVNLERIQSNSDVAEDSFILVNIAAYKAAVVREGGTVWTTKVIVGDKEDETPVFRSNVTSVVFNPTWSVPHSIASEELLPKIKKDPEFFSRGGYRLYDRDGSGVDPELIDWGLYATDNFPFRLMQLPGSRNQLGQIKFMIPNPYSVCMHDTPAKNLFANSRRALSHGCIRVDDPLAFAEVILAGEEWTREQIDAKIDAETTATVTLSEPLPVHVVYWTATVDRFGEVHFYRDIYGRDASAQKGRDGRF